MAKILNAPNNGGDWPRNVSAQELDGKRIPPGWPWPPPADAHLAVPVKHRFLQRLVWWARDSKDADLQPQQDRLLPAEMDVFELVAYALQRFLVDRKIEAAKMGAVTPIDQAFSLDQAAEEGACGSLESVGRRAARCLVSPVTLSVGTGQDLVQAAESWFDDAGQKTPNEVIAEAIRRATLQLVYKMAMPMHDADPIQSGTGTWPDEQSARRWGCRNRIARC